MILRNHERLILRGIATTPYDFSRARQIIATSGSVNTLAARLYTGRGRPRRSDLEGFLVAAQANALRSTHTSEIVEITRVMNGFTPEQREAVGLVDWTIEDSYDRADRLFNDIAAIERTTVVGRDPTVLDGFHDSLAHSIVDASIPKRFRVSDAIALDGTDIETWGRPHFREALIPLDGEPGPSSEEAEARKNPNAAPVVFGTGPDGRNICTKDIHGRGGHRSATNSRRAGRYTGYEDHLMVQTRSATIANPVDGVRLGEPVPEVIRAFALTEAGAHRARVCRHLIQTRETSDWPIEDVIADRGMSMGVDEWQLPLRAMGKRPFFDLHTNQRGQRETKKGPDLVDGWPVSRATPSSVMTNDGAVLPMPPRNSSPEVRATYQDRFSDRGTYTFRVHALPDEEGAMRFCGPFRSGRVRSEAIPESMRLDPSKPLISLPADWTDGDDGLITFQAAEIPLWQPVIFGTPAWFAAYVSRRQAVESANAGLKEAGANIGARGHFKVFRREKLTFLMAFEIAAYNVRRCESFEREQRARNRAKADAERGPRSRSKRRNGTYAEILDHAAAAIEEDRARQQAPP